MIRRCSVLSSVVLVLAVSGVTSVTAQGLTSGSPRVLIVIAHPDDDASFTGVVYQITHQLDGIVDLALVTDGSGGFRYSTLAEDIYGLELTDEAVAREHLPTIRKRELMAGGEIVGISRYYFFDQLDDAFSLDPAPALTRVWDADWVRDRLVRLMQDNGYDLVLAHLPFDEMHGHHKAATILALEAVQALPEPERPVVLGGFACELEGETLSFAGSTAIRSRPPAPVSRWRRSTGCKNSASTTAWTSASWGTGSSPNTSRRG